MSKKSEKPYKRKKLERWCTICNKEFFGCLYKFNNHLFSHNAIPARYSCDVCPKKFYRKCDYKTHSDKHKGVYSPKQYTCDRCNRTFVLKNNLIIHLIRVHGENLESKLGRFTCNICKTGYCDRRLLYKHIRRVHLNVQFTREPLHTQKLINETWIERVVSKSATVSMTKVNNNVIVIKRLKIDVKPGACEEKLVEYTHDAVDQYSKGICDHCGKEMYKKSLRTHIREVHMDIRKFKCNTCNATFARRYQKTEHKCGHFVSKKKYRKKNVYNNVHTPNKKIAIRKKNEKENEKELRKKNVYHNVDTPNKKTATQKNKVIEQTVMKDAVKLEPVPKKEELFIVKKEF